MDNLNENVINANDFPIITNYCENLTAKKCEDKLNFMS